MAEFIGIDQLQHIADQYTPEIVMGASYFRPEEMTRLGIKVISGVQFKNTKTLLARKGGTTRRKVVGDIVENKIGFLKERTLVAKLTWNRYKDNRDNYVETPYQVEGSAEFSYPMSEAAFKAITANYGEDLYANLFFGDIENGEEGMDLYDGFHTLIAKDIADGYISLANGNMVHCEDLDAPDDAHDFSAWTAVENWILGWNGNLKNQPKVLLYCSTKKGVAIANAYANKWHGNSKVNRLANGNFTVDEFFNVEFVPSDIYGEGDRLVATVPGNLEYGVNSEDSKSKIVVREGSDADTEDITFQVQSIQGCRLFNPLPSHFCMSDGDISAITVTGDYKVGSLILATNNADWGTVAADKQEPEGGYKAGTTLTLTATVKGSHKFVKWSDGVENATRQFVTTGLDDVLTAVFAE